MVKPFSIAIKAKYLVALTTFWATVEKENRPVKEDIAELDSISKARMRNPVSKLFSDDTGAPREVIGQCRKCECDILDNGNQISNGDELTCGDCI